MRNTQDRRRIWSLEAASTPTRSHWNHGIRVVATLGEGGLHRVTTRLGHPLECSIRAGHLEGLRLSVFLILLLYLTCWRAGPWVHRTLAPSRVTQAHLLRPSQSMASKKDVASTSCKLIEKMRRHEVCSETSDRRNGTGFEAIEEDK